jgi:hypothetical protein
MISKLSERYTVKTTSNKVALKDVAYLIGGHLYGETSQDITVVLDKDDTLELLKDVDTRLYNEVSIDLNGEYFYISSVKGSNPALFVENAYTTEGILKYNETDILILPSYLPVQIKDKLINDSGYDKCIELTNESVYEKLVEIIKN